MSGVWTELATRSSRITTADRMNTTVKFTLVGKSSYCLHNYPCKLEIKQLWDLLKFKTNRDTVLILIYHYAQFHKEILILELFIGSKAAINQWYSF